MDWPFLDPPNVAAITTNEIVEGRAWIAYVTHDADDGAWQFLGSGGAGTESDARVVSLRSIVESDETIKQLADLPLGWHAWRENKTDQWKRQAGE
jgi:hypothetical protein